ncbi:hypothetical protein GQX59_08795 [Brachyspira hyodysenteriae]|uniref:hypothetical protein n=1 Tax=Brachyspira hyodysenteriae TaxID=159 RepID=UPI00063DC58E|nr:hypothetical protein [Brachyspira hyodysenteriae]KLI29516.1 hypothetical protein SZ49_09335 [Brachyspira hyodysenteriae]KLI45545.1 hypothetical protein SZ41_13415 [Brachyspira hyodysenteriae]KLI53693.1 hypothetical protein SZ42_00340 [Brachyspira hyodysenteriae]QTM11520.1 hypothetical protein GQX59_08795 [Brachyspira hyodysenteriae]HJH55654.1 hypothetical protein [Brachyspira hyodysenteriae]
MDYIIGLDECINKLKDDNELDLSIKAHLLALKKENVLKKLKNISMIIKQCIDEETAIKEYASKYEVYYNELADLEYNIKNINYQIYKLKK